MKAQRYADEMMFGYDARQAVIEENEERKAAQEQ